MFKYTVKRLIALIPVILGVTLLIFMIMNLAPGDPARIILGDDATPEQINSLRNEMGLNDPLLVQYFRYITNFVRGDMGTSYATNKPVSSEITARFPYTIRLALVAGVLSVIFAIPLGIISAVKQNTIIDNTSMIVSLIGVSMPIFWLGLLLVMFFSIQLGWLPVYGADDWKSYILPSISLSFMNMAAIARTTRSSMLETIRQDYVRTARAKGLSKIKSTMRHAFQNALIPTITVVGIQMGQLLGGAVLTETIFAWPGLGRHLIQAINNRDMPTILGCIIVMTVSFSLVNLIVDLVYGLIDPRVRSMYR